MATGIKNKVAIIGMGCTKFGERWDMGAEELMVEAFTECIADAGLEKNDIEAAWLGTCLEEVNLGKTAMPLATTLRLPMIPVTRVENYCATGTESFRGACYAVASGAYDICLAKGEFDNNLTLELEENREFPEKIWKKAADLFFSNCRIPKTNRLGDAGSGFLLLMMKLQQERLVCAMCAVFAAERIMEFIVEYCKNTMVNNKPLVRSQAVQFDIVEMTTEVKIGRTFIEKLCADHMEGENVVIETSMAKYWTTDMVNRIAEKSMDLCGESALLESNIMARAKRDVRVMSIFAGTNEIMKGIAAKFMGF